MKKLLFGILFVVVGCAGTQDLAPDGTPIPIGVNTIIIHSAESQETEFQNIGSHLIQKGYTIRNSSPEFFTLSTEFKNASRRGSDMATDVSISASVIQQDGETKIILNGQHRQGMRISRNAADLGENTIVHSGQSGSLVRVAWNELYQLAQSFSENLSFETR